MRLAVIRQALFLWEEEMPYIQRDPDGQINSVSIEVNEQNQEWIEPDSPELREFLVHLHGAELPEALGNLISTDQRLIRVLEDLVDTLIAKDLIHFTDLPEAAQQKLLERRSLRTSVNALKLLRDDDQGLI
jgi:hypothetical protein